MKPVPLIDAGDETEFGGKGSKLSSALQAGLPVPPGFALEDGAAFAFTYGTSHHALIDRAQLQPGETVLVLGAGGGVGTAALQIASGVAPAMLKTGTSICSPKICSCSTAAGRCMSAATNSTLRPSPCRRRASLAALVVLPDPCKPTIMIFVVPRSAKAIGARSLCIIFTSSSWHTLTN